MTDGPDTPKTPESVSSADEQPDLFEGDTSHASPSPGIGPKAVLFAVPDPESRGPIVEGWDYSEPKPADDIEDPLKDDLVMTELLKGYSKSTRDIVIELILGLNDAIERNIPYSHTLNNYRVSSRLGHLTFGENKVDETLFNEVTTRINDHNLAFGKPSKVPTLGFDPNKAPSDDSGFDPQRLRGGDYPEPN